MKKLIIVLFFVLVGSTPAFTEKTITFIWDANTDPNLMGYRIYQSRVKGQYTFGKYSQNLLEEIYCLPSDQTCCTFTIGKNSGRARYYVSTAIGIDGFESGPSDEVKISNKDFR